MGGVFLSTLAGAWLLPQPYSRYAGIICLTWFAAMFAYDISLKSKKTKIELLKDVVLVAVGISAIAMLYYGEPTYFNDHTSPFPYHSDYSPDDGFDATFEQKAAYGVRLFLQILIGGVLGVQAAFLLRTKEEQMDNNI